MRVHKFLLISHKRETSHAENTFIIIYACMYIAFDVEEDINNKSFINVHTLNLGRLCVLFERTKINK